MHIHSWDSGTLRWALRELTETHPCMAERENLHFKCVNSKHSHELPQSCLWLRLVNCAWPFQQHSVGIWQSWGALEGKGNALSPHGWLGFFISLGIKGFPWHSSFSFILREKLEQDDDHILRSTGKIVAQTTVCMTDGNWGPCSNHDQVQSRSAKDQPRPRVWSTFSVFWHAVLAVFVVVFVAA